jgi:hypothetical protein
MNFRQTFSFYKKKLKLKTKDNIGLDGYIYTLLSLQDGSIIIGGYQLRLINSSGIKYPVGQINPETNSILKILPTGEIDSNFSNNLQNTLQSSAVYTAVTDGTSIYLGGTFNRKIIKVNNSGVVDSSFSDNLDITPGVLTSNSGFNGQVNTIVLDGSDLYVGGNFTAFKGVANNANKIAKLSTLGIFDTSFSDNLDVISGTKDNNTSGFLDGNVRTICKIGNDLYVGGGFTRFKSTQPNAKKIAKINIFGVFDTVFSDNLDVVPGTKNSTTSGFNNEVYKIITDEVNLYVVGQFTKIKSNTSSPFNAAGIAKLDLNGVFNTTFSDNLDLIPGTKTFTSGFTKNSGISTVNDIVLDNNDLFIVGDMQSFKGILNNARGLAKLSTSGVFDTGFSDNLDLVPGVKTITSGFATSSSVILMQNNSLYLGGYFDSFKNSSNKSIIKISKSAGIENFLGYSQYGFGDTISAVAIDNDGNRYIGGYTNYLTYNGRISGSIIKILPNGEVDETFLSNITNNGFDGTVRDILVVDNNLYAVGNFTSFNGIANNAKGIAKFSTSGIFDTNFSDNLDITPGVKTSSSGFTYVTGDPAVYTITTDGSNLYVGGNFGKFKSSLFNANKIAKLDLNGVFNTSFSDNLDVVSGTKDQTTSGFGFASSNYGIRKIIVHEGSLYIGGDITRFKQTQYNANGIAKLSTSGIFDTNFSDNLDVVSGSKALTSGFDGTIFDMCLYEGNLYAVGNFSRCKTSSFYNANKIAKLDLNGVFNTTFSSNVSTSPAINSGFGSGTTLYSICMIKDSLIVGGSIYSFKGISDNSRGLAKLSTSGVFDTGFSNFLDIVPGTKTSSSGGLFPIKVIYNSKYNSLLIVPSSITPYFKGIPTDYLFSLSYMD